MPHAVPFTLAPCPAGCHVLPGPLKLLLLAQASVAGSAIPVWAGRLELPQGSLSTPGPAPRAAGSLTGPVA